MLQIESFEMGLRAILKAFPPNSRFRFGEDHWRVISGIVSFGKRKFSVGELLNSVNEDPVWHDKPIEPQRCEEVLENLEKEGLAERDSEGNYELSHQAVEALGEFFSLVWRPRGGKTGFMNYLLQSKQRTIQWYCVYKGSYVDAQDAAELTEFSIDECKMYLERLARHHQLLRTGVDQYRVLDEKKILKELMDGYGQYRYSKPTVKEFILLIMQYHDKISGKDIHEQLKHMFGIDCHPTTVYKHLRKLTKEGIVKKTGEIKKVRGAYKEYYTVRYEDIEAYKRELLGGVQESLAKVNIRANAKFFALAAKQEPSCLRVFLEQLRAITAQGSHDESSCVLWATLKNNMLAGEFHNAVSKLMSTKSEVETNRQLTHLVRQYKISPALILMFA